jgi:hypothetical protein
VHGRAAARYREFDYLSTWEEKMNELAAMGVAELAPEMMIEIVGGAIPFLAVIVAADVALIGAMIGLLAATL